MEDEAILEGFAKIAGDEETDAKGIAASSDEGLMKKERGNRMETRIIDGVPVLVGQRKIIRRRKRPKPPMRELGFEKLKPRQKLALVNRFELGMSNKQAAIEARYSEGDAHNVIPRLLARKPIVEALKAKGITDEYIAGGIVEGTKAMHPFRPDQPDHGVRIKYYQETNKLLDNYPDKKIQIEGRVVNLHLTKDDYIALKKYEELRQKKE